MLGKRETARPDFGTDAGGKILAPVDRVDEVGPLARAGAQELYGGVQPRTWTARYSSANQRTFASAQFPSESSFAQAVGEARRVGAAVHLTLNAPVYDPLSYPDLMALAERAAGWGVYGVIVGDLGLLARLREAQLPLEVTLSTMAGALNQTSVRFYKRFLIDRVVLPRHLTLSEMKRVVRTHPDILFEAFILVGRCPNEEAYCSFQHVSPAKRWPCEISYELKGADEEALEEDHPFARWHRAWNQVDRRLACGLCALEAFLGMGVQHFKLVGRGGPTDAKVASVRLVSTFLARNRSQREARDAYRARFGRTCHPLVCYCPELHPDG